MHKIISVTKEHDLYFFLVNGEYCLGPLTSANKSLPYRKCDLSLQEISELNKVKDDKNKYDKLQKEIEDKLEFKHKIKCHKMKEFCEITKDYWDDFFDNFDFFGGRRCIF